MITGQGQLKIGGVAMELSFTVPAGVCPPQALLPEAQRLADRITDHAAAGVERAGHRISCQNGWRDQPRGPAAHQERGSSAGEFRKVVFDGLASPVGIRGAG